MERDGLIKRVVYPVVPPMVEYSLTTLGQTLIEPIWALRDWSEKYIEEVERIRAEYDQTGKNSLQEEILALVQKRANRADFSAEPEKE